MKFTALLTACTMLPAILGAAISDFPASVALDALPVNDGNAMAFVPTLDTLELIKEIGLERRDILEARQANQIINNVRTVVGSIARSVFEAGGSDNNKRSRFTTEVVGQCRRIWPQFSWVATHTAHEARWDGREGSEWGWVHQELRISLGRTKGYAVNFARSGSFELTGDGGLINWAWAGNAIWRAPNGRSLIFAS